ncbi:pilus assembly protein Flp/PilA [Phyllobacterium sp. YR620]|nr:pilus assembly protein Flp/PilA [Phyllobacterium sp. YR620]SFJ27128.1 pilus assembly protein Flp/PilA [Phyllobacterium sp. CL33Tsu]
MIMSNLFARFLKDESGATAIEYGLIAALISVGIIAGVRSLGSSLSSTFNTLGTTMTDAAN